MELWKNVMTLPNHEIKGGEHLLWIIWLLDRTSNPPAYLLCTLLLKTTISYRGTVILCLIFSRPHSVPQCLQQSNLPQYPHLCYSQKVPRVSRWVIGNYVVRHQSDPPCTASALQTLGKGGSKSAGRFSRCGQ